MLGTTISLSCLPPVLIHSRWMFPLLAMFLTVLPPSDHSSPFTETATDSCKRPLVWSVTRWHSPTRGMYGMKRLIPVLGLVLCMVLPVDGEPRVVHAASSLVRLPGHVPASGPCASCDKGGPHSWCVTLAYRSR